MYLSIYEADAFRSLGRAVAINRDEAKSTAEKEEVGSVARWRMHVILCVQPIGLPESLIRHSRAPRNIVFRTAP